MLLLVADENFNGNVVRALLLLNPGVDQVDNVLDTDYGLNL